MFSVTFKQKSKPFLNCPVTIMMKDKYKNPIEYEYKTTSVFEALNVFIAFS